MHKLRIQQHKIKNVSFRLKKRDRVIFQTCICALENHNKDRATICANEIAEIKKLTKFLYHVELAIEQVILRLETIRELSEIMIDLKPALRMLQGVSKQLFEVLPNVSSELSRVNDLISETLYSTRMTTDGSVIPVNRVSPGGKKILKEVSGFIEQKIAEKLPEPPATIETGEEVSVEKMIALGTACSQTVSQEIIETEAVSSQNLISFKEAEVEEISLRIEKPSLEDVVLEYVKKSEGEVDLMRCSVELKASYSEIEDALQSLGTKGKIRFETRAR
jgi:division protein CdvB (Snf7/Vps24/ESCRT-III family)